jgi:hypothetical protein
MRDEDLLEVLLNKLMDEAPEGKEFDLVIEKAIAGYGVSMNALQQGKSDSEQLIAFFKAIFPDIRKEDEEILLNGFDDFVKTLDPEFIKQISKTH